MATRTTVRMIDDLDGSEAVKTITFSLDGVSYEIDLSESNADKLGAALQLYLNAARRTGGRRSTRTPSRADRTATERRAPATSAEVRGWAAAQGLEISARGRIPAELQKRYDAAH